MPIDRPYGADDGDIFDLWLKRREFRYAPKAGCLHWLAKGRCAVRLCMDGHSSREWMDHVSGYTKGGERYLLCQPYQLSFNGCRSLMEACQAWGLHAWITGNGWYGHGTLCIELEPEAQFQARMARHPLGRRLAEINREDRNG
jgi:hypothetical protein